MDKGLITQLLKTPSQIRAEEQKALREKGLQRAALVRGSGGAGASLFGGMFRDFAAQQAAQVDTRTDQLKRGLMGAVGMDSRSAAEQQAVQQQEQARLIQGADNLTRLKAVKKRLEDQNASPVLMAQINQRIEAEEAAVSARAKAKFDREQALAASARADEQLQLSLEAGARAQEGLDLQRRGVELQESTAEAGLYEKFTADSIVARRTDPTAPLVPLPKATAKAMSSFGKQLADEGIEPGTPEFIRRMNVYNEAKQAAADRENDTTQMSELKQIDFLQSQVLESDAFQKAEARRDKIDLARETITDPKFRTNSNAIRVTERTVSEIYNSDSRAASEIDRFLTGKGIAVGFADWAASTLAGSISVATQENLTELINIGERAVNRQTRELVSDVRSSFEGIDGLDAANIERAFARFESEEKIVKTTGNGLSYTVIAE